MSGGPVEGSGSGGPVAEGGAVPEDLLAQALRAKAGRGAPDPAPSAAAGTAVVDPGDTPAAPRVPGYWILLLALLLGLATGAVMGLITLL